MSNVLPVIGRRWLPLALSLGAWAAAWPALAQDPGAGKDRPPAEQDKPHKPALSGGKPASPNATVNLVRLLVERGILTEEQAAGLIKQAEDEAYVARQASQTAAAKADEAAKTAASAASAASPPGTKRVTYVPEIVKRELREQLKKEVMETAKNEKWAAPNSFPDWASHIRFFGDVRLRYQLNNFPKGNDTSGNLINWNAINTGSPFDFTSLTPPIRDADQNRNRFLLQARLGMEADLFDGFTAGLRIATGDSSVPISTQETLGGGGGNFSKQPLWLDRGFLRYQPTPDVALMAGRFDNPFFAPTDLVWYRDLAFDGAAVQAKYEVIPGVTPFLVAGAFPLYNTLINDPNSGGFNPSALGSNFSSEDKYLFAVQAGLAWKVDPDIAFKLGAAYYDYNNVQGQLSDPCFVETATDSCDTDALRPSYAQSGNSYMALRNIIATTANSNGTALQFQYYGLASPFRVVEVTSRLDLGYFNPVHLLIDGTYVNNVAFNWQLMNLTAVNNRAGLTTVATGPFEGGNEGFMGRLTVGYPELHQMWDWNVYGAYKYLQSDATLDAFVDPDFGFGGTNLKGYIVGTNIGLGANVWATVKWLSASSIAGPPFAVDALQVDLNGRF